MRTWFPVLLISGLMIAIPGAIPASDEQLSGSGLIDSPWPCFRGGSMRTGASTHDCSANNGKLIMVYPSGDEVRSSPSLGRDGTVYFGSMDGRLYAYYPNGTLRWYFDTEGGVCSSPALLSDGTICFGSLDGGMYSLYPNGSLHWVFRTAGGIRSSPAVREDGIILFGSRDYCLHAVDPEGIAVWSYRTDGDVDSSPAIGPDGSVYFGSDDHNLYALHPDGKLNWTYPTLSWVHTSPAIGPDGRIYFGSDDDRLFCLGPDGGERWTYTTGNDVYSSPAIGLDGTIYFGSDDDALHAVTGDGAGSWSFEAGNDVFSSPSIDTNGMLLFGSRDGSLYAVSSIGEGIWEYDTGSPVTSSPSIGSDGTVYIGSLDGNVYAIGMDIGPPSVYSDQTDSKATTGDPFTFKALVKDDNYIEGVGAYVEFWYGAGPHINVTLEGSGEARSYTMDIASDLTGTIYYRFHVSDLASQWSSYPSPYDMSSVRISDDDPPTLTDLTEGIPTTGDPFKIRVIADDNVGLRSVTANWSHGDARGTGPFASDGEGNLSFVLVMGDTNAPLRYEVTAIDRSGSECRTSEKEVAVLDNDAPKIEDLSPDNASYGDDYRFEAIISDNVEIEHVDMEHWCAGGVKEITEIASDNGTYMCSIPVQEELSGYLYYSIHASDSSENTNATSVREVPIYDTDPPMIDDTTTGRATTGDPFRFSASVQDDIGASNVIVEYGFGAGERASQEMRLDGVYSVTICVPANSTDPILYRIHALDRSGNEFTTPLREVEVVDDDPPVIATLEHPDFGSTGDTVTVHVKAMDNIGILNITLLTWSAGSNVVKIVEEVDEAIFEVQVPFNSTDPLHFRIECRDLFQNLFKGEEFEIVVWDNDPPVFIEDRTPTEAVKGSAITVEVEVLDNIGVSSVIVVYELDEGPVRTAPLLREGDMWFIKIGIGSSDRIVYSLNASDVEGNSAITDERTVIAADDVGGGAPIASIIAIIVAFFAALVLVGLVIFLARRRQKGEE